MEELERCQNKSPSGMYRCKLKKGHEGEHQEVVLMTWEKNKETHRELT